MNLDSLEFLFLFLPAVVLINYILPHKFRPLILLISSLAFFFFLQPQMLVVLLAFTLCDYVFGYVLSKTQNAIFRKTVLVASVLFNVAVFVLSQYTQMVPYIIGVSVISLVKISYVFSVYNGKIPSTDNIIAYLSNVFCFPTAIAGPINDYVEIGYNIKNNKKSLSKIGIGASEFIYGLFKKVVIADNVSRLLSSISPDNAIPEDMVGAILWVASQLLILTYTLLGYSQMARGICKMLGFDVKSNFHYPFTATTVKDFFNGFNVTLNSFVKKYVYIPLGGSQKGTLCMITSTLLTTLLATLWYGFSLNTVLCAFYFATIIILEKVLSTGKRGNKVILNIFTLITLLPGYLFLITSQPSDFSYLVSSLLGQNHARLISDVTRYYLGNYWLFLLLGIFFLFDFGKKMFDKISRSKKIYNAILLSIFNIFSLAISVAFML